MFRYLCSFLLVASPALAGPFGPATAIPETTNSISWLTGDRIITTLALAPINGDAHPDAIALSHSSDEIIWLDLSTGTPVAHSVSSTVNGPEAVVTIEATGDAHNDIIVSSRWDRTLLLFTNDGSGNFSPTTLASNVDVAVSLSSADLDGNNEPDIIGVSDYDQELFWISQSSAGNLAAKQTLINLTNTPTQVVAVDINNDTYPDILVLNGGRITVFENDGSASFTETTRIGSGAISSFDVADLTGGQPDIIASSSTLGASHLYTNDNSGNFSGPTLISASLAQYELTSIADLDRDNQLDLLYSSHTQDSLVWLKGDGTGSFVTQTPTTTNAGSTEGMVADFDGDLDADLVQASLRGNNLSLHQGLASTPYDFWAYDQDIDPAVEITTDDTNSDGINNLLHYATNTEPNGNGTRTYLSPDTGTSGLPARINLPNGDLAIEFIRRTSSRPHGLTYILQQSSTMSGWTSVTLNAGNSTTTAIDSDWERIRYTPPAPQGTRLFLRLQVDYTNP